MRPCRPACRSGRLDHALPRSLITHARQVPRFVSPSGRRPASNAFLSWLFVFPAALVPHWLSAGARWWCCPARRAALQKRSWPQAIHLSGGGAAEGGGTPKGCPGRRPLCGASFFRRWSSYPRFLAFKLQAIFIGKKKLEAPYRFRGGAIYREKGVRFIVDNRPRGGAIYRSRGVRFIVEKLVYPQGLSTDWACFWCFSGALSLVTGLAPGRAYLSPKMGEAWGGAIYRDGDAGTVASSPRCRHET